MKSTKSLELLNQLSTKLTGQLLALCSPSQSCYHCFLCKVKLTWNFLQEINFFFPFFKFIDPWSPYMCVTCIIELSSGRILDMKTKEMVRNCIHLLHGLFFISTWCFSCTLKLPSESYQNMNFVSVFVWISKIWNYLYQPVKDAKFYHS